MRSTPTRTRLAQRSLRVAQAIALATFALGAHAESYFTESAAQFDALTAQDAVRQDFSGGHTRTGYAWSWGDVTFTCNPVAWCNNPSFEFGGYSTQFNFVQGNFVYYAPPDTATFTFASPIIALGFDVFGIGGGQYSPGGALQPTPMLVTFDDGSHEFFPSHVHNYNISVPVFAGMFFDRPVTSITVSGEWDNNGMFFTNMRYVPLPVPEPATYAMLSAGLALLGAIARRQRSAFSGS